MDKNRKRKKTPSFPKKSTYNFNKTDEKPINEDVTDNDLVDVGNGSLMSQSEILDFSAGTDSK